LSTGRYLRSVAHTRPAQLLERARRIVRQRAHDLAPHRLARALEGPLPPCTQALPPPLLPPRSDRVTFATGEPCASFLSVVHSLRVPIDWRLDGAPELERMNLHYMEYLEAVDDERFMRIVADWIEQNSLAASGSWRIAWNSFVVSLRVLVWMQQLALRWERLSATFRERAVRSLVQQLRFLDRRLELDIGGNHLIKNAKSLLWASHFFTGGEPLGWGSHARRILIAQTAEQILADGVHYERSPTYHVQVFADLLECASLEPADLAEALRPRLDAMAQAVVDFTHPDGFPSQFGDGGMHMAYSAEECLIAYEHVMARPRPQPRGVFGYRDAGYFGARHGDSLFIADCGAIAPDHLPAHGHGDVLAFEWTMSGRRLIVDAGTYEYERGALRNLARSTGVHNTVTVDHQDQAEFWAAFRVGRRPRVRLERFEPKCDGFVLEGSHDGYRHLPGSPVHRRRLVVEPDSITVDDSIEGGRAQPVDARLLSHPDVVVEATVGGGAHLRCGDVALRLETPHPISLMDASWWPDFGVSRGCTLLVVHYPPAPCRGAFRLRRLPHGPVS
jgi:uncharacterized heparinase superfamily protein